MGNRCSLYLSENDLEAYMEQLGTVQEEGEDQTGFEIENPEELEGEVEFIPEDFEFQEPTPEEAAEMEKTRKEQRKKNEQAPACKLSRESGEVMQLLMDRGMKFLKNEKPTSSAGLSFYQQQKVEGEYHRIQNLLDIISWYRFLFEAKTYRAVSGMSDEFEEEDPVQNDWNGTAKVVLVGIRHCTKAAKGLLELIPSLEDELLLTLKTLQKFEMVMESTFPKAHEFIRPGFDTLGVSEDLGT